MQVTIKLKTAVGLGGKMASPEDENKGIYTVNEHVANDLIARKRAVLLDGEKSEAKNSNNPPASNITIEEVKTIADALEMQYRQNIGVDTLSKKILSELEEKGKEFNLNLVEVDIKKAYELYQTAKANKGSESNNPPASNITIEELKAIAEAADIDLADDADYDTVKEIVEIELEQYASELKVDLAEDATIKEIWAKIEEKLKANDG